jgi:branched-chain amino acid transport system ATP-binding protein
VSLLAISDLRVAYGNLAALQGVTLHVEKGEVVALIGANGAGKSTLLKAIMRLVQAKTGNIEFDDQSLLACRTHDMARLGIAFVPEGRGTLRRLSVRENLLLGAFSRSDSAAVRSDLDRVVEQFPMLKERLSVPAGALSGGQQQMLVIGRGLMCRPRLMLLDEPSLGLAPKITQQIFEIIAGLTTQGVTVLLVEQNARAALKLVQRAYVLEMGRIVLEGTDLIGNPRVREAYLGEIEPPKGATVAPAAGE